MVAGVELDAVPGEMAQPRDHQRLLGLHLFKRFLLLGVLRRCRVVRGGWDSGNHHSGVRHGAEVPALSGRPVK